MKAKRRVIGLGCLITLVIAGALLVAPAAWNSSAKSGFSAYVASTNRGPLPGCVGNGDCTATNATWSLIHVVNGNDLPNFFALRRRDALENAFVVTSVDASVVVDGVSHPEFDFTYVPPPNTSDFFTSAGWWPSTVTCGQPIQTPCNVVGSPAVIPGENAVILYSPWVHAANEPRGKYVLRFTIHGTVNGESVDLTASSPQITMG
jgi:hypothetical protein